MASRMPWESDCAQGTFSSDRLCASHASLSAYGIFAQFLSIDIFTLPFPPSSFLNQHFFRIREFSYLMDPLSLTAGVIAVVQLAEQVVKLCHGYIQYVQNFPRDIRMILIEISALKDVFQNLLFLNEHDAHCSAMLTSLLGADGPIHACRASVATLETCLRPEMVDSANKRRKLRPSPESPAWNFKEGKVRQAPDEIRRHKETINLAFSSETM